MVILGAGFGGLYAARALAELPVRVTVVDRRNHHLFQPLLYQVATAALNPSDIASPIRSILRGQRNARVLLAEATAVDVAARRVLLADADPLSYDFLIVATGAAHAYFGHDAWAAYAPGLKTVEDALEIRRRVLLAYESAEREDDPARRRAWLTFVAIGGGPTGVELAGALAEIAQHALERDFRAIDPAQARIVLVEASPRILGAYPPSLSARAQAQLERLGVEVRTGARVTGIDAQGVTLAGDQRLAARTVLWAAGVAASPLARTLGAPLDRAGRVHVAADLTVPGRPEVFVIGDLVALEQDGAPIPGIAPAAIQQGRHAARTIERALAGEPPLPFRYLDKGSFATIGRGAAVGQIAGRINVSGFLAWMAWLFIHILYLIGFRNRLLVMFDWAYNYLTWRRGARLITGGPASVAPAPSPSPPSSGDPRR
ncbi:MAG TPA: NAD(P)/FAD-dependent oxidoreductase [Myxococcota bacterium]|nr:NAD(P)/FAD-dependent oxidoreductase [Myxococcota bacterium]